MAENTELRSFTPWWEEYYYVLGRFLSIDNAYNLLAANHRVENERGILQALIRVRPHHFPHMQVPMPVYNVKHVTENMAVDSICNEEGFLALGHEERPEFRDLSYWSAEISLDDLENARQKAYEKVSRVISPLHAITYAGELREQVGNSPAFRRSVSRYGNFQFSFPLQDLLTRYKDQHCNGGMPRLKILGTGLYKLEIAHYVVVHSPNTDKFNDFPEVPTVHEGSDPLPFVYWMDGQLYWRPESTSTALKVMVTEDGQVHKKCYRLCDFFIHDGECFHTDDGTYSVWNHLILAFHLPGIHLKIPKEQLVKNLTACDADDVYLGKENLERKRAEEVILRLEEEVARST